MTDTAKNLFTPWHPTDNVRCHMELNDSDNAKIKRGRWKAIITDQITGKRWHVRGSKCTIPRCYCDATLIKEICDER